MKLILKSDFRDYYDHLFDTLDKPEPHNVLSRFSKPPFTRKEGLSFAAERLHKKVVKNGALKGMPKNSRVVVYYNEYGSRGYGKELMLREDAIDKYGENAFACLFLEGVSIQEVHVGYFMYIMQETSDDAWRSNVGNVKRELTYEGGYAASPKALWSVRQVGGQVVDYNASAYIDKDILEPELVMSELREWYAIYGG